MKPRYVVKLRRSGELAIRDTVKKTWGLGFGSKEDMELTARNLSSRDFRSQFKCIPCNDFALPSFKYAELKVVGAA